MKDDEIRVHLQRLRRVLVAAGMNEPEELKMLEALDRVLDPQFGTIAMKQTGWNLAHERANLLQEKTTEIELLKLRIEELEHATRT